MVSLGMQRHDTDEARAGKHSGHRASFPELVAVDAKRSSGDRPVAGRAWRPRPEEVGAKVLVALEGLERRALIADALRVDGHEVDIVATTEDFLDYLAATLRSEVARPRPDVLVTDLDVPGGAGLDVLATLRAHDLHVEHVLVLRRDAREARDNVHPSARFVEPFDMDDLRTIVLNLEPANRWRAARTAP